MTTTNGWPGKPGVPLNPERDGAHRLRHHDSDLELDALWSCGGTWLDLSGNFSIPHAAAFYDYLGPCLTPDQATALQKRVAELETALAFIKDAPDEERKPNWNNMGSYEAGLRYCAAFANAALTGGEDEA